MRTKKIKVYKFDELSDSAKEAARAWWRRASEGDDFWHENVIEDAKQCFALAGFDIDKVYFTGFWSQGDGACFVGSWRARDVKPGALKQHAPQDKELHRIAAECERIALAFPDASARMTHRDRYCHEYSASIDVDLAPEDDDEARPVAEWDALAKEREPFTDAIVEVLRDAMRWTYRTLEKEYEWQNADEQVDDNIRANEYEFTAEGKRCAAI